MKKFLNLLAFTLGAFFVFSGLVKVNDPVGTAIKLEEYFEVFSEDFASFFHYFIPVALPLALFLCIAEIMMGAAMMLRYKMKLTMTLTVLLLVFFSFLTFYSAYFNKVTDCGCFGDFIKLKPWESFTKDLVLLGPSLLLLAFSSQIQLATTPKMGQIFFWLSGSFTLGFGLIAIRHLPFIDWRPYAVGANLPTNMKPSAPLKFSYTMSRGSEKKDFEVYPEDTTWKYESMQLLNPEAKQKITDYRVWTDEADYTDSSFAGNKFFIIIQQGASLSSDALKEVSQTIRDLNQSKAAEPWILTSLDGKTIDSLRHDLQLSAPFFYVDGTVLKTIMRSKIGFWQMHNGTVVGKWSDARVPSAEDVAKKARG